MLKRIVLLLILIISTTCFASDLVLRDYDEYKIPAGYHLPIMNLQEFSTAYTEEGELLNFVITNNIYLFDKNVIPQGSKLTGFIEKKNEPIRGTNASMKVFINKMYLPNTKKKQKVENHLTKVFLHLLFYYNSLSYTSDIVPHLTM